MKAAAVVGPPSCPFPVVGCNPEIVWQIAVVRENERRKASACAEVCGVWLQRLEFRMCACLSHETWIWLLIPMLPRLAHSESRA